ncbi:unnamed protein product [Xylocopa violacea]|uniref:Secreted protein n=1 Tax=Xylocopa violacea TaxID=135666 RepID=A0ABP1N3G0_XYLVO
MRAKLLYAFAVLVLLALLQRFAESKKVTVHIPYRIRNVKHTHTVYKIVPHYHEDKKEDGQKIEDY